MHPSKANRDRLHTLTDLPNVGAATAADLRLLGIETPNQLLGKSAYAMHADLCALTGIRHDPCVIDVFLSITRYMAGDDARPWWAYTAERKQMIQQTNGNR